MRTIDTTIDIDAPAEAVWAVIADFARYPEWNPFITALEGDLRVGARLRATFSLAHRKPRTFTPRVTVVEPGHELAWRGGLAIPNLFDTEHTLRIEADGPRCRFIHIEHFRGALVPFVRGTLAATHDAFVAMDSALARRALQRCSPTE